VLDAFSGSLSTTAYRDVTRWVYAGVTVPFGVIGVSAAFLTTAPAPWVGAAAILTTVLVFLSAVQWPRSPRFALGEISALAAVIGWIAAVWAGAGPVAGFAFFLPFVYGIATRRPWWPWVACALATLIVAPLITRTGGHLSEDWVTNQLIAVALLGAEVSVFLGIELGWVLVARIDAHRAGENELSITRERLRFANELHDVQGHTLLAIKMKAELARRSLNHDLDTTRTELADIERLVAEASAQTRQIANGYRTVSLATELANAEQLLGAAGIRTTIQQAPAGIGDWEPLVATATREAVNNILRHAAPTEVTLRFTSTALVISNDGARTDHDTGSTGGGNGLSSLRDRFAEHGGTVHWALDGDVFTLTATRPSEGENA